MAKYLSGRVKRVPQSELTADRYQALALNQAEPNLGDPSLYTQTLPIGVQQQLVSVIGYPGQRYWIPVSGISTIGGISIYDENIIVPTNAGVGSITQINFVGAAISAKGYLNLDGSPGIGVTITVFSPGSQGQVIFNNNNDFKGASSLFYDNSTNYVGIGTTIPTQELDINGDLRLRGTIYDYNNQPGNNNETLVKNNFGGLTWINQSAIRAGAGGTITNIQYHNSLGLVDGASDFVFDYTNNRVGIGTTIPSVKLDVIGSANISGNTKVNSLNINTTGIGEGDLGSNGGTDGIFVISNTTNSGSIYLSAKNSSGTLNNTITLNSSSATVNGSLSVTSNITNGGFDFVLGNTDQSTRGNSGSSRALVKDTGATLALNYAGDFTGGVRVDSKVSVAGTITATVNNTLTETRGSHLRITNAGNGGDAVMSWDSTFNNANQRWYAGIDVSDSYAWKLANPIAANFDNEEFGRLASGGNPAETKLKIDTSGNASFLGGLTLNTNKFTVAGDTGNTVIAGSLNIGGAFGLSVSGSSKFSVDASGNVTNSGTLNSTGKIKTFDDLEVIKAATVGTTLGVTEQVTAGSFKVKDATDPSLLLRATGVAAAITKEEINVAVGFIVKESVSNSALPNGNSISLYLDGTNVDQTNRFDGNRKTFPLKINQDPTGNEPFTPISSANLLVSVGGVIQKPETDYTVSGSDIIFNWAPATGLSFFIIAFGGLGGLRQNQDWDGDKGTLLVGSATDNLGIKFPVGGNDQVLTVNLTKDSGLEWRAIPRDNLKTNPAWDAKGNLLAGTGADTADILGVGANNAILTADSNSSTGLAWKTTFTGNVTGNVTGNATGLSGTPNITVGTVTANSFLGQTLQKTSTINLAGQFPSSGTQFINAIPSSANEITVLFSNIRLPDSGHFLISAQPTTGGSTYYSNSTFIRGGVTSGAVNSTTGLIFYLGSNDNIISGQVTLKKSIRVSGNHRWIANGTFNYDNIDVIGFTHGYLETTESAPVTRIFISNSTAVVFAAGEVSVQYQ